MTKDNQKKFSQSEADAITAAFRSAVARGDIEEIERLNALVDPIPEGKAAGCGE